MEKEAGKRKIIYKMAPDSRAISDLLEFVVGKAPQTIDSNHSGSLDTPAFDSLANNIQQILAGKFPKPIQSAPPAAVKISVQPKPPPPPAKPLSQPVKKETPVTVAVKKESTPAAPPAVQPNRNYSPLNPALILKR
jgi:hypothetical protein